MSNILDVISSKESKANKRDESILNDVNHDLITALFALPLYGKVAHDEEILTLIINAGVSGYQTLLNNIREQFNTKLKAKEIKKSKDGHYRDKAGFIRLRPR